ncbi:MAG: GIY-YIG nuclease family protein [Phycisphaeraceae bacterium]|nr:GIY-YIG nuclease family protein [Phycisphaeraceae bacterium]
MDGQFWYVYMLQSIDPPGHWYVGMTGNLAARLKANNALKVPHTLKFAPWRIESAVAFREKAKAVAFEKYLKSQEIYPKVVDDELKKAAYLGVAVNPPTAHAGRSTPP